MVKELIIAENGLDVDTWEYFKVESISAFISKRYEEFPSCARIYHVPVLETEQTIEDIFNSCAISQDLDVTPRTKEEIEQFEKLEGRFIFFFYPEGVDPFTIAIITIAVVAVAVTASFLLAPAIPSVTQRNTSSESPNNELSERKNSARLGARIPDIFGQVRSTPDLLTAPYKIFEDHREVEVFYGCVGRGEYAISDVRDGDTPLSAIGGASAEFYGPNTSPNYGTPILTIGKAIPDSLYVARRLNEVNGQVLNAPNAFIFANSDLTYISNLKGGSTEPEANYKYRISRSITKTREGLSNKLYNVPFTDLFEEGDFINITGSSVETPSNGVINFNGYYRISAAYKNYIVLDNPQLENPNWDLIDDYFPSTLYTPYDRPTVAKDGVDKYIGFFYVTDEETSVILANFVALNGLYKENGSGQEKEEVTIRLYVQQTTSSGTPINTEVYQDVTLEGSSVTKTTRAVTVEFSLPFKGPCRIRAKRITDTDISYDGSRSDEVKWRDCYAMNRITQNDFGDVTTVHTRTLATDGALAIKERRLNCLVTRKIPTRLSSGEFTTEKSATSYSGHIISAVCKDPYIGGRKDSEIDFDNIYTVLGEVDNYFGTSQAYSFSYTFDKESISFEETIAMITQAVFCTAYRQGSKIRVHFEKETPNSVMLFNHRNKIPNSEKRTISFGNTKDYDGVEFEYVDPKDDAVVKIFLPENRSSVSPKKIESIGVRSRAQAYFAAWRAWNKIQYQSTVVEFEASEESNIVLINDRILVADNTRTLVYDGEVESQSGLVLTLSQPFVFSSSDKTYIQLQHRDGTTESIRVTAADTSLNKVTLANAPRLSLSLDLNNYTRTLYNLVSDSRNEQNAFLVVEKNSSTRFTNNIKAINYDPAYYMNDGLSFWLPIESGLVTDRGPWDYPLTVRSGGTVIYDALRKSSVYRVGSENACIDVNINSLTGAYTKSLWVRNFGANARDGHFIAGLEGDNLSSLFYDYSTGRIRMYHAIDGDADSISFVFPTDGAWHHIACTYSGTSAKIFLDGELQSSGSLVVVPSVPLVIAGLYEYGSSIRYAPENWVLDDIRHYARALSEEAIKSLYQRTKV